MRAARAYALGIALSFALLLSVVPSSARAFLAKYSLREALLGASWFVAGLSALAAARDFATVRRRAYSSFALGYGFAQREDLLARLLVVGLRIAAGVLVPVAVVVAVARLTAARSSAWCVAWLFAGSLYALALGAVLAGLALACSRISPRNARTLLLVVVLAPELLRYAGLSALPSLPAACSWAIGSAESLAHSLA